MLKNQTKAGFLKTCQKATTVEKVCKMKFCKWREKFIVYHAQTLFQNCSIAAKIRRWGNLYGRLMSSQSFRENCRPFNTYYKLIQTE